MTPKEGAALTLLGLDQQNKSKPWEAMSSSTTAVLGKISALTGTQEDT